MNIKFNTFNRKRLNKPYFVWFEFSASSYPDEKKITGCWIELTIFNRMFNVHIWATSKEYKKRLRAY